MKESSFDGNVAKAQLHLARLRASGVQHFIDGAARPAVSGQTFENRTPLDDSLLSCEARPKPKPLRMPGGSISHPAFLE